MRFKFRKPKGWRVEKEWGNGFMFKHKKFVVIVDHSIQSDNNIWIHLSASHESRVPTHREMAKIKNLFIGENRYACSVFPSKENYVNIHPNCLHIFARDDCGNGRALPEFSGELNVIGKSI